MFSLLHSSFGFTAVHIHDSNNNNNYKENNNKNGKDLKVKRIIINDKNEIIKKHN